MDSSQLDYLIRLANRSDRDLNLLDAALAIASIEYPTLDRKRYRTRLDAWAQSIRSHLPANADAEDRLRALNAFMFTEQGFSGNVRDYYDPRNSYLNEVLDRRLGIPITLSVIYMELGRLIGLDLEGVSFPGHFLVKLAVKEGAVVLDPFNGGVSLDEEDLTRLLGQVIHDEYHDISALLVSATKHDILMRMLRNLKSIYQRGEAYEKALYITNIILGLEPTAYEEYRDRGLILLELDCNPAAIKDLHHYVTAEPDADDAQDIRAFINELQDAEPHTH